MMDAFDAPNSTPAPSGDAHIGDPDAPTIPSMGAAPPVVAYPPAPEQYLAPGQAPGQPPSYGYSGQTPAASGSSYAGPYPAEGQPRYDYQYGASPPFGAAYPMPGSLVPPPRQPPVWLRGLARPFPLWVPLGATAAIAVIFALLAVAGDDWAQSALFVGLGAGVVFLLIATLTLLRTAGGMAGRENSRRAIQYVSAGLTLVLLLGACGASLALQKPLHRAQARSYEGQRQWQLALSEFKQAGESAPGSADLARIYNEWAEQSAAQGQYGTAIDFFNIVLKTYPQAQGQVARARSGMATAYLAWGKAALDAQDYASAEQRLDILLALDTCDSSCQAQAGAADATAYYNLAEAALATQAYDVAVDKFHSLLARFPASPESAKAHSDLAKSLLGLGQKQRAGVCNQAIPTYQELSTKFGDTPEGQSATAELAQPQAVMGRFTKAIPAGAYVILAKGMYQNIPNSEYTRKMSYPAPRVHVNADGTFRFASIAQGTWDIVWATVDSRGENYLFYTRKSDGLSYYQAQVGPLCPADVGTIEEDFPAAP